MNGSYDGWWRADTQNIVATVQPVFLGLVGFWEAKSEVDPIGWTGIGAT